jgi:phosphatidate phosphatase APP1
MRSFRLLAAFLFIGCIATLAASAQSEIALSIYVHEGNLNGTMLSDVRITGQDAEGNSLTSTTEENGIAVIKGMPGTWQLDFEKSNYQPLELSYNALQTEEVAAYLEKTVSSQPITLTVYVYEGSLNGTELSGVQITGRDAAGGEISATTDADGAAVISGTPGSWELSLAKDGYESVINLSFEATETEEVGAYLIKAD